MNPSATAFRLLTAAVGVTGLVLSFLYGPLNDLPMATHHVVRFFTFFTMLTNLFATAAMAIPVWRPKTRLGQQLMDPGMRTSITSFIIIVCLVYHYLLFDDLRTWHGLGYVSSIITHYLMPFLMLTDWVVNVPRGTCRWMTSVQTLAYPSAYLGWVLTHGALTGWYPYPFLDVSKYGLGTVMLNATTLAALFFLTAASLLMVDRLMLKLRP